VARSGVAGKGRHGHLADIEDRLLGLVRDIVMADLSAARRDRRLLLLQVPVSARLGGGSVGGRFVRCSAIASRPAARRRARLFANMGIAGLCYGLKVA